MHKRQCGERGAKAARLAATGHSRTLCTYDSSEVFASMRSFRIASSSANLGDVPLPSQPQMVSEDVAYLTSFICAVRYCIET